MVLKQTRFSRTFTKLAREVAAKEGILEAGHVQSTVSDENYKWQRIQRIFSKFTCPKQLFEGAGQRQVESAAKCDTWIFYANNGESDAITGP